MQTGCGSIHSAEQDLQMDSYYQNSAQSEEPHLLKAGQTIYVTHSIYKNLVFITVA